MRKVKVLGSGITTVQTLCLGAIIGFNLLKTCKGLLCLCSVLCLLMFLSSSGIRVTLFLYNELESVLSYFIVWKSLCRIYILTEFLNFSQISLLLISSLILLSEKKIFYMISMILFIFFNFNHFKCVEVCFMIENMIHFLEYSMYIWKEVMF